MSGGRLATPEDPTPVWTRPDPPRDPEGECRVEVVPDAVVTGFGRQRLPTLDVPGWRMVGAVHRADGSLVPDSQRTWSTQNPTVPVASDPLTLPGHRLDHDGHRLGGRWVYAGHWTRHFGHFLLETLPTLWPDPTSPATATSGLAGILTHRSFRGPLGDRPGSTARLPPWQQGLLDLAGYGGLPVHVVRGQDVRVDELVVATRPVVFRAFARPEAVALWQRAAHRAVGAAADRPGPTYDRVFWSRTGIDEQLRGEGRERTTAAWDHHLDQVFGDAGFAVLRPETLPVREQVVLARGARVMAGSSGSALHLSALADPSCRVIEIGDNRSPAAPQSSQVMVDAALGRLTAFVPHEDRSALTRVVDAAGGPRPTLTST